MNNTKYTFANFTTSKLREAPKSFDFDTMVG